MLNTVTGVPEPLMAVSSGDPAPSTAGNAKEIGGIYLRDDGALDIVHFDPPRTVAGRNAVRSITFDDAEKLATFTIGDGTHDASGLLLRRRLAHDAVAEIAGVVCAMYVEIHPNGRVRQTTLGAPLVSRHGTVPAGSRVDLDDRDELTTAVVAGPCTLRGGAFEANDRVIFTDTTPAKQENAWIFYTPHPAPERESEM